MKRAWIRSSLFNVTFIVVNAICCIVWLPTLLLPRHIYNKTIDVYHYVILAMEYFILGLRYEVIGAEHLPKEGSYIVAAKHMSAYETFKLRMLFNDPAIILKKELLKIPLWGQFLKKSGVIAIDRSTPEKATESIRLGALEMKKKGRPIIIFPQGTRVWPHETSKDKRYKSGIYRIQKATGLTIIPMATNSGCFWPRSGWLKSSGIVTFKFLPPIESGKSKDALMSALEKDIEAESNALIEQAQEKSQKKKGSFILLPLILAILIAGTAIGYTYLWKEAATLIKDEYVTFMANLGRTGDISEPTISGFPGPITLNVMQEEFERPEFTLNIKVIEAKIWPLPMMPITLNTGPITLSNVNWNSALRFDSFSATFTPQSKSVIDIQDSMLKKDELRLGLTGEIDVSQKPFPKLDTVLSLRGFEDFIASLSEKEIIEDRIAMFLTFGFQNLTDENGVVRVPLLQRGNKLYAGPLPITDLPQTFESSPLELEVSPETQRPLEPYNQLDQAQ